jgi:hypothetical protein
MSDVAQRRVRMFNWGFMGEWVWLSFVHESFARELDRIYGRSAEPARGWNNNPTVKRWVLFVGAALVLALLLSICFAGGDAPG